MYIHIYIRDTIQCIHYIYIVYIIHRIYAECELQGCMHACVDCCSCRSRASMWAIIYIYKYTACLLDVDCKDAWMHVWTVLAGHGLACGHAAGCFLVKNPFMLQ